jgi:hypothetical protein
MQVPPFEMVFDAGPRAYLSVIGEARHQIHLVFKIETLLSTLIHAIRYSPFESHLKPTDKKRKRLVDMEIRFNAGE